MFKRKLQITPETTEAPSTSNHEELEKSEPEDISEIEAPSDKDPFLKYKIFKQVSLILIWLCLVSIN